MADCFTCGGKLGRYKKKYCGDKCKEGRKRGYVNKTVTRKEKDVRPVISWLYGLFSNRQISTKQFAKRVNDLVK